jgi:hypothetical protein
MLGSKRLFRNAQDPLIERFGLRQPTLLSVELCQRLQSIGHLCVFRPERFFLDRQRALEEWLSFGRAIERFV